MNDPLGDKIHEAIEAQPPVAVAQIVLNADGTTQMSFAGEEIVVRGLIDKMRCEFDRYAVKKSEPMLVQAPLGIGMPNGKPRHR